MVNVKIEIDGNVEFNGNTDQWAAKPPSMFKDAINPNATPKPWLKSILIAFADAVMQKRSTEISVTTRSYGWDMSVRYEAS